jgi:hypothetical protein
MLAEQRLSLGIEFGEAMLDREKIHVGVRRIGDV